MKIWILLFSARGLSTDCPNIINLASGLHLDVKQPAIMTQIQTDCCSASGVHCDSNERVTHIDWNSYMLDGTIIGTALPSSLQALYLYSNLISGTIPSLPDNMLILYLEGNLLTGPLPTLPPGLIILDKQQQTFR